MAIKTVPLKYELDDKTSTSYSAEGDSSAGGPQHLGADSFDYRPERYEWLNIYICVCTCLILSIDKERHYSGYP